MFWVIVRVGGLRITDTRVADTMVTSDLTRHHYHFVSVDVAMSDNCASSIILFQYYLEYVTSHYFHYHFVSVDVAMSDNCVSSIILFQYYLEYVTSHYLL